MISPEDFKDIVRSWAEKIGVTVKELHMRKMTRKWASCSSKGRITFDPDILVLESDVQDSIIVHELLHIRYPDHGRMFKTMLKMYLKSKTMMDIPLKE